MSDPEAGELVFVVDVTSFTQDGFVGSTTFGGDRIDLEFDDHDEGVFLDVAMCKKIHVKAGSNVTIVAEDEPKLEVIETKVESVASKVRISNAKLYYIIGRSGGGIFRIRKA
jgi:hypothetical protein